MQENIQIYPMYPPANDLAVLIVERAGRQLFFRHGHWTQLSRFSFRLLMEIRFSLEKCLPLVRAYCLCIYSLRVS